MAFIQNLGFILMGFIAIVSVFLIILALLEKKLHIKLLRGRYARNQFYIEKIARLDMNKPIESIKLLDKIAKTFFREAFRIQGTVENSELEVFFQKKHNRKATEFSQKMTRFLYSKETVEKESLQDLVKLLAYIISSNKIITKDEKEELDKKSLVKKSSMLGKLHISSIGKKELKNKKDQSKDN